LENLKGKEHLEDLGIDERRILQLILRLEDGRVRIGRIWLRIGNSGEPW
jgi:hypothetical protein